MLGALRLTIALVEDEEDFARIKPRLAQRKIARSVEREPATASVAPS
jgi:hypothetical protein